MPKNASYADLERKLAALEQKLAEQEDLNGDLFGNERKFREFVQNANSIILRLDTDGNITFINNFGQRFLGYTEGEIIGKNAVGTIVPMTDSAGRNLVNMIHALVDYPEKYISNENENICKNGERVWVAWTNKAMRDKAGLIVEILCIGNDITDRKQAEDALQESVTKFRNVVESSPMGIHMYELMADGRLVFSGANPAADNILGIDHSQFIDKALADIFPGLAATEISQRYRDVCAEGIPWHTEQIEYEDRQIKGVFEVHAFQTAPGKMATLFLDITERKKAEERLKESEEKFRNTVEAAPDGIAITRIEDGLFLMVNQYYSQLTGYGREETIGKKSTDLNLFVNPGDRDGYIKILKKDGFVTNYEFKCRTKTGAVVDALLSARPLRYGGENCMVSVVTDITSRKHAEEELVRLAIVVEQANESIIITDRAGLIIYVNPAFEKISGYGRNELLGRNFRILKSDKHDNSFYHRMWVEITGGNVWKGRIISKLKDNQICQFETSISPIRDDHGAITHFVSVNRDVTQEVSLENQLRQAQKMEAMGTLAGGIAHDFNNILGAIMGYTELSMFDLPKDSMARQNLKEVLRGTNRAKDLVTQILAFSRQSEKERKPIYISLIIREALKLLRASLPSTIQIHLDIEPESDVIIADSTQIHQVIMNLGTNAGHAMREQGGLLEMKLSNIELDEQSAIFHPDLQPGSYFRLRVSDSGPGISSDVIERIFDPYFTTKEKGEGTGLGLAVVQGIIKSHGGATLVESLPGSGATFTLYLPRVERRAHEEQEIVDPLRMGKECILYVDDEEALADMGRQMLNRLGYEAVSRTSSIEAYELFRKNPKRFDLVITDMTMPNMTGDELAYRLMDIRADIPVILCSGYSEQLTADRAEEIGIKSFIHKPLVIRDLAAAIRSVLDKR